MGHVHPRALPGRPPRELSRRCKPMEKNSCTNSRCEAGRLLPDVGKPVGSSGQPKYHEPSASTSELHAKKKTWVASEQNQQDRVAWRTCMEQKEEVDPSTNLTVLEEVGERMSRLYHYQGPQSIAQAVAGHPKGSPIRSVSDLEQWIEHTHQQVKRWGVIAATFVITQDGILCLADRHSEHVACAGGRAVRSAGELFLTRSQVGWKVSEVSNQSTGYCPEPASWAAVATALDQIPLPHPGAFTHVVLFRRCPVCRQLNLIKEEVFVCSLCDSELPREWNLENSEEV